MVAMKERKRVDKAKLLANFGCFKMEPSTASRAKLVEDICIQFNSSKFSPNEYEIICDILSYLAMDVETKIRISIAESLKDNEDIPHFLAKRLAYDVNEVATPILQFSQIFSDDDLKEIIESTGEVAKLQSIAKRDNLPDNVSYALIEKQIEEVVITLLNNPSATISDESKSRMFECFNNSNNVLELMVKRGGLNPTLATRIISFVSQHVAEDIIKTYNISTENVDRITNETEQNLNIGIINNSPNGVATDELVDHLYDNEKLSYSIILNALCRNDMNFFCYGLSKLTGISYDDTVILLNKGDTKGFYGLFKAASIPDRMSEASYTLFNIIKNIKQVELNSDEYYDILISEITKNGYDDSVPNMKYFLAIIDNIKNDTIDK